MPSALARIDGERQLILTEDGLYVRQVAGGHLELVAALEALKADGRTILIVSHKLSILPVVDRLLVLRDGRVEMFGPRDEVLPKIAPNSVRRMHQPVMATA